MAESCLYREYFVNFQPIFPQKAPVCDRGLLLCVFWKREGEMGDMILSSGYTVIIPEKHGKIMSSS